MTIEQYSEMIQHLNNSFERMSRQIGSSLSCYSTPQHLQPMYDIMQDRFQSFGTDIGNQFAITLQSQLQNISTTINDSFMEIGTTIAKALSSAEYGSALNELFSSNLSQSLSIFAEQLSSVVIHAGYVDFPESLIPDDFEYEEVEITNNNGSVITTPTSIGTKKISITTAITLICTIITTLLTFSSWYQTTTSTELERIATALENSNILEIKRNELLRQQVELQSKTDESKEHIQVLEDNIAYLYAVLNQLEATPKGEEEIQSRPPSDEPASPKSESDPPESGESEPADDK